jgi:hypothetical protein
MTNFDQQGQIVSSQQNAEIINNFGISFEDHKKELERHEERLIQSKVDKALTEKEKLMLEKELQAVQDKRLDEKASYRERITDLEKTITRLIRLKGQIPDKLIDDARQALIKTFVFTHIQSVNVRFGAT